MQSKYEPPFQLTEEIVDLVSEISEQVGLIGAFIESDLPSPELRKENHIRSIQASLAIEQNTLSVAQVTDIVNGKHVVGTQREIQEVKNAIKAYDKLDDLDPYSKKDFLKSHGVMMQELVKEAGKFRTGSEGVFKGSACIHMAPPASMVPSLIERLFKWVKSTKVHPLIKSCVFHYELEFIHPFADGNGRMGRFWQTILLTDWRPVFAWIPVETIVKKHQQEYYKAIGECDNLGNSTIFIKFMLQCIDEALKELKTQNLDIQNKKLDIESKNSDIDVENPDIQNKKLDIEQGCNARKFKRSTREKILKSFEMLHDEPYFAAAELENVLGCSHSTAADLMQKLVALDIVEHVAGRGKGKYKFKV